jgi:hypothetical protein
MEKETSAGGEAGTFGPLSGPSHVDGYLVIGIDDPAATEHVLKLSDRGADGTGIAALQTYLRDRKDEGALVFPLHPDLGRSIPLGGGQKLAIPTDGGPDALISGITVLRLARGDRGDDIEKRLTAGRGPILYAHRPAVRYPELVPVSPPVNGADWWGVEKCGFPDVWNRLDRGGEPQPVGVIDQGHHGTHPEIAGRVVEYVPPRGGTSSISSHAAAVTAVLAAHRGETNPDRMFGCCSATIHLYDVWARDGFDFCGYYRAFRALRESSVRVVNLSMGSPPNDPTEEREIRACVESDMAMVAAVGVRTNGQDERHYPAVLPGVIAVGATNPNDNRAACSTAGKHVFISAPGERITTITGSSYKAISGTSFAAPMVSAAIWLALRQLPCLTLEQIRNLLRHSVAGGVKQTRSNDIGWGRLDVGRMADHICAFKGC